MEINYNTYLKNQKEINLIISVENYTKTTLRNRFKQVTKILNEYKIYLMNYILNNEYLFYSYESLKYWINLYEVKYYTNLKKIYSNEIYLSELKNNWSVKYVWIFGNFEKLHNL